MAETSIEATPSPEQSLGSQEKEPVNSAAINTSAPNGGFKAWSQAAAGHLVIFNCWGYLTSFGLFQSYYTTSLNTSPSAISWIGSVQIFLIYFIGTFSGRALDAGHFRTVVTLGSILQVLGVFTTSVSTQYWQLFLAQGLCKGLGDGLVFCPTISLIATYFTTKRSAAIGIAASGGATGGIIFPLIAHQLLPRLGFGWTVRTMAFLILLNATVFLAVARTRLPPRKSGPLVEWAAFRDPAYTLFCTAMFFNLWAVFFAYFYLPTFATTVLHATPMTALTLLLTLNALGLPARLAANALASSTFCGGPLPPLAASTLACAVLCFAWPAVDTIPALYGWAAVYGIFGGAVQSLFPAAAAGMAVKVERTGTWTGMCFSGVAGACLTGPVVGGVIVRKGGWVAAEVWGGAALVVGSLGVAGAWWVRRRKGGRV